MLRFKIKLKGLDKGKIETKKRLMKLLFKSMLKMEEIAQFKAPVDIGLLRQMINVEPLALSTEYKLTAGALYSAAMEFGTRPHWVPITPLKEWAKRKIGDEDIAYAIRAKIAKDGVTAHPFMRPALFEVQTVWFPIFKRGIMA